MSRIGVAALGLLILTTLAGNSLALSPPSGGTASKPRPSGKTGVAAPSPAVRAEIERLESNDEGRRATGAAALAAMGIRAAPAVPWLFAAVDDLRPVNSLLYGRATVAYVAGRALRAIGPSAVDYVMAKLRDPKTSPDDRSAALRAVAIMHRPEMLTALLQQLEIACAPGGNACSEYGDALECYLPDPRIPEAMLRMAEELERRGDKSPSILISFTVFVRGHEDGKNDWVKTVTEAKDWWAAHGASATLGRSSTGRCAEKDPGH